MFLISAINRQGEKRSFRPLHLKRLINIAGAAPCQMFPEARFEQGAPGVHLVELRERPWSCLSPEKHSRGKGRHRRGISYLGCCISVLQIHFLRLGRSDVNKLYCGKDSELVLSKVKRRLMWALLPSVQEWGPFVHLRD